MAVAKVNAVFVQQTMPLICILFVVRALGLVGMLKSRGLMDRLCTLPPRKTASSDEELAFKQKERDIALYTRKVRKLFQSMDDAWMLLLVRSGPPEIANAFALYSMWLVPFHDGFVDAGPQKAVFGLQANCGCNMFLDVCCIMLYL
jgi:hypothetical protein